MRSENNNGSGPQRSLANSLKLAGYDFHFGSRIRAQLRAGGRLPESLAWCGEINDPRRPIRSMNRTRANARSRHIVSKS